MTGTRLLPLAMTAALLFGCVNPAVESSYRVTIPDLQGAPLRGTEEVCQTTRPDTELHASGDLD